MKQINEFLVNAKLSKIKHTQDEVYNELNKLRDMIVNVLENTLDGELKFTDPIEVTNVEDYSTPGRIVGIRNTGDMVEVNISWGYEEYEWQEFTPEQFHVEDMCWVLDNIIEKNYEEV